MITRTPPFPPGHPAWQHPSETSARSRYSDYDLNSHAFPQSGNSLAAESFLAAFPTSLIQEDAQAGEQHKEHTQYAPNLEYHDTKKRAKAIQKIMEAITPPYPADMKGAKMIAAEKTEKKKAEVIANTLTKHGSNIMKGVLVLVRAEIGSTAIALE
jgi:hypothetical protein